MSKKKYLIYGAGGYCKVVIDIIQATGGTVACVFDDFPEKVNHLIMGVAVRKYAADIYPDAEMIIAIGHNEVRKNLSQTLQHDFGTIIHPKAVIASSAKIGQGTVVMANAIVQAEAELGEHVIINAGVCVDHEAILADFTHIGALAYIGGAAELGEGCNIRPGALIKRMVKVPEHTFVGPNAIIACL